MISRGPIDTPEDIRSYKPFIDGLRAIAILTVVASHVDLPGLAGGYVGVDIFFVISGYLIINQIAADIAGKRFSLFEFGARRAFRILPAFLLVMLTCLVLVTTVFVQPEYKDFAQSFFFSAVMLVNHHYLAHQGYFDMAAFTKPLLHMWSLSVEEQFYLLAPLSLLGLAAATATMNPENARRAWIAAASGMAVLSFAACVAFTYPAGRANISFYVMPARGWEFILGGLAPHFVPLLRARPAWISGIVGLAGVVAIGLAVVLFNGDTLYPSYRAALPAFGAMLIIVSGLADPRNGVARVLAIRPMIGIGLVSYAWYLWHWPLISFIRTMNFGGRDLAQETAAAALALVLAVLTYRLVEIPVRNWRHKHAVRPVLVSIVGPVACVLVACVGYLWSVMVAPRMLPTFAGFEPLARLSRDYPPVTHRGVLLGDSHASIIAAPLQEYASRAGSMLHVIARAGCPPLLQTSVKDSAGRALLYCDPFFRSIAFDGAEFVIITARWNFYLGLPPSDPFYSSSLLVDEASANEPADPYGLLARGLAAALADAKRAGVQRILVMGPLPEFPVHPPYCLMRTIRVGIDSCILKRAVVDARRARTIETLRKAAAGAQGVRLIDPIDLFCTKTECRPNDGRTLYFVDSNHLSTAGAARVYQAYEKDFLWALTGHEDGKPDQKPGGSEPR